MPRVPSLFSRCRAGGLAAALLLPALGCEPPVRHLLATQDFEALAPGAANPLGLVRREQAHGGQQALVVGVLGHDTGNLLCQTWGQLGRPHRLRWRAWVWLPHGRARIAFIATKATRDNGTILHEQRQPLVEVVCRYGQWVLTTSTVRLPSGLQPTDTIMVFAWVPSDQWLTNAKNTVVYLDDFSLESLD